MITIAMQKEYQNIKEDEDMAMEIAGNYDNYGTNYAGTANKKQAVKRRESTEKAFGKSDTENYLSELQKKYKEINIMSGAADTGRRGSNGKTDVRIAPNILAEMASNPEAAAKYERMLSNIPRLDRWANSMIKAMTGSDVEYRQVWIDENGNMGSFTQTRPRNNQKNLQNMQKQYSGTTFTVGTVRRGQTYGNSSDINFVINPGFVSKLASDSEKRERFEEDVKYLTDSTNRFKEQQAANGWNVENCGWFCDKEGNWGGWCMLKKTGERSFLQKMQDKSDEIREEKNAKRIEQKNAEEKKKAEKSGEKTAIDKVGQLLEKKIAASKDDTVYLGAADMKMLLDAAREDEDMAMEISNYSQFYKGTERIHQYGGASAGGKDTLVKGDSVIVEFSGDGLAKLAGDKKGYLGRPLGEGEAAKKAARQAEFAKQVVQHENTHPVVSANDISKGLNSAGQRDDMAVLKEKAPDLYKEINDLNQRIINHTGGEKYGAKFLELHKRAAKVLNSTNSL